MERGVFFLIILLLISIPNVSALQKEDFFESIIGNFLRALSPQESYAGELAYYIEDPGNAHYILKTSQGNYKIEFSENMDFREKMMIEVNGVLNDGVIYAESYDVISGGRVGSFGNTINVAFVRVAFHDAVENYPYAEAIELMEKANLYYQDVSYGQALFNIEVFDQVYTLGGVSSAGYCNPNEWRNQLINGGDNLPDTASVNWEYYDLVIMIMPQTACTPWYGLYSSGFIWLNGPNSFDLHTVTHEMGHYFGIFHASDYECDYDSILPNSNDCGIVQYGDTIDIMGAPLISKTENTGDEYVYEMNLALKDKIGWIGQGEIHEARFGEGYGIYDIMPIESGASLPKGIKAERFKRVQDGGSLLIDGFYYIEYRRNIGADAGLNSEMINGVLVRTDHRKIISSQGISSSSQLIDLTPNFNLNEEEQYSDSDYSVLKEGDVYWDGTGFFIKVLSLDEEKASVWIEDHEICRTSADENCDMIVDCAELDNYIERYNQEEINAKILSWSIESYMQNKNC